MTPPPATSSPFPRLRGKGRGEGTLHTVPTRGGPPHPPSLRSVDLSPQAGQGEVAARPQPTLSTLFGAPLFATAILAAAILPSPALAQDAGKPIRVIVATGVGGTADVFMRVLGDEYHKRYGRPFVVENRTGGGMNIGGRACADAPNDGSTICNLPNTTLTATATSTSGCPMIRIAASRSPTRSSTPSSWW